MRQGMVWVGCWPGAHAGILNEPDVDVPVPKVPVVVPCLQIVVCEASSHAG